MKSKFKLLLQVHLIIGLELEELTDPKKIESYLEAANLGNELAQCLLGNAFRLGFGVEKNITQAERWLRRARWHLHADKILEQIGPWERAPIISDHEERYERIGSPEWKAHFERCKQTQTGPDGVKMYLHRDGAFKNQMPCHDDDVRDAMREDEARDISPEARAAEMATAIAAETEKRENDPHRPIIGDYAERRERLFPSVEKAFNERMRQRQSVYGPGKYDLKHIYLHRDGTFKQEYPCISEAIEDAISEDKACDISREARVGEAAKFMVAATKKMEKEAAHRVKCEWYWDPLNGMLQPGLSSLAR